MAKTIIAVMGATGTQGSGVVADLLARGQFAVRALTRNPNSEKAKALKAQGCEVLIRMKPSSCCGTIGLLSPISRHIPLLSDVPSPAGTF